MADLRPILAVLETIHQKDGGHLRLVDMVTAIEALEAAVRAQLPPTLADEVFVGGLHDQQLVLLACSAAIAARLRLEAPRLRQALGREGLPVREVRIRVASDYRKSNGHEPPKPPIALSPASRARLLALAKDVEDPALRRSIKRLANVGRTRPKPRKKAETPRSD